MSKQPKVSEDEKRWRAESDAQTLAMAETIKGDPSRMKAAAEVAKAMAADLAKKVAEMERIAGTKAEGRQSQKAPAKPKAKKAGK